MGYQDSAEAVNNQVSSPPPSSQSSEDHHNLLESPSLKPPEENDKNSHTQGSSSQVSTKLENEHGTLQESSLMPREIPPKEAAAAAEEDNGRERLIRHRVEVAGRVLIPDIWGQEGLLKDWIDCSVFESSLVPSGIMSARAALVEEGRRPNPSRLRVENRC